MIVVVSTFRIGDTPAVLAPWLPHISVPPLELPQAVIGTAAARIDAPAHPFLFLLPTLNSDWPSGVPGQAWHFTATRELV